MSCPKLVLRASHPCLLGVADQLWAGLELVRGFRVNEPCLHRRLPGCEHDQDGLQAYGKQESEDLSRPVLHWGFPVSVAVTIP